MARKGTTTKGPRELPWPEEVPRLVWQDVLRYGDKDGPRRSLARWLVESFPPACLPAARDALAAVIAERHPSMAAGRDPVDRFNRGWPDLEAVAAAWNDAMQALGYG